MAAKPLPGKTLKNKPTGKPVRKKANFLPHLVIFVFAFLLYGNTIPYDYTLDDLIVIKDNAFTQKGLAGIPEIFRYDSFTGFFGIQKKLVEGGRYRPLSIATFAIEVGLTAGLHPALSHLINILLYALSAILIYLVFSRLVRPPPGRPWYLGVPFVAALLFLAHPLHTEVVANIKGRDEILALLFSLTALNFSLQYLDEKKKLHLFLANLAFFLGLLSKENAILFAVIIPLTIYFFTRASLRQNMIMASSLGGTALIFILIRFAVLGYLNSGELPRELLNNPFLFATTSQRVGTILYTLGLYIKLLFLPYPLTHDYYPYHIPLIPLSDFRAILPLILYLALILVAAIGFRKKSMVSYGILFYLLTLFIVSNLVFPVGTFMNERFVYMPSLGFVLIVAYLAIEKLMPLFALEKSARNVVVPLLALILTSFGFLTVNRNPAWKDNFTLFTTDVKVSVNSIKCNISAGGDYQKKAELEADTAIKGEYYRRSIGYLEKALSIYPRATNGLVLYGNVLAVYKKDFKQAIGQYLKVLEYEPLNGNALSNTLQVMNSLDNRTNLTFKIAVLRTLLAARPDHPEVNYTLGKLYGQFAGNLDSSRFFLERSAGLDPTDKAVFKDLGIVYSMQGDYQRALDAFGRAQKLDPADAQIRQNIAITYQIMNRSKSTIR